MTFPLIALLLAATSLPANLYGTYSSYQYVPESGDLVGMEIVVLPGSKHPEVVFQCAEGAPSEAILTTVEVSGSSLLFEVPPESMCGGHYEAHLTINGLRVSGGHQDKPSILHRRKSYWADRPAKPLRKATSPR